MKRIYQLADLFFMFLLLLKNDPAPKSATIGHIL